MGPARALRLAAGLMIAMAAGPAAVKASDRATRFPPGRVSCGPAAL